MAKGLGGVRGRACAWLASRVMSRPRTTRSATSLRRWESIAQHTTPADSRRRHLARAVLNLGLAYDHRFLASSPPQIPHCVLDEAHKTLKKSFAARDQAMYSFMKANSSVSITEAELQTTWKMLLGLCFRA